MRNVKNITINGVEYPCLLTVTVVRVLEDAGFTIRVYENPAAMLAECVKIVWAGCKNYAEYLHQPFDLTLMDVDIWATENKEAFAEIVTLWAELNKPAADRSGMGGKEEEKKKN